MIEIPKSSESYQDHTQNQALVAQLAPGKNNMATNESPQHLSLPAHQSRRKSRGAMGEAVFLSKKAQALVDGMAQTLPKKRHVPDHHPRQGSKVALNNNYQKSIDVQIDSLSQGPNTKYA